MRSVFILIGICISGLVAAQQVDTASVVQTIDNMIQISRNYIKKHDFENAEKLNTDAEKMTLEILGKNSISYGKCCFNKGKLDFYRGEYLKSEKWYLEYSSIIARLNGEDNMDYAWSLNDLGQLYSALGQFDKAEAMHIKSKEIIGKIRGFNHPDYAWSLNDLAVVYRNMGAYEKAEPLYLDAKLIREKTLGKNHTDYAWSLNNLANLYNFMGSFEKAEPLYLAAKGIWENLFGKENENYASVLNNLASLYFNMAVYGKAEPLFLESCNLREKLLGKNNPDYAGSLNNLASLYMEMGNYQKAEPLFLESKSIREKIYGKNHAEYANLLGNLGILYNRMANYEKSEAYFLESKSIWEIAVGLEHPDYATSIFNLANFYLELNQLDKAEPLLLKSYSIREKSLGMEHPDCTENQRVLSKLFVLRGKIAEAIPIIKTVSRQHEAELLKAITYLSEHELTEFIDTYQYQEDELGTYYACPNSPNCLYTGDLASIAYDHALFYKGFLLSAAVRLKTLAESTKESKEIYLKLKSYRRRLANEYALPIDERTNVAELEAKENETEKELTVMVSGYAEARRQVNWQDVQNALQKNEAAIEFVHFKVNFPRIKDSIMYVALLVKKDVKQPILISMFEEKSIDSLLHTSPERKSDYVNGLYTLAGRGAVSMETPKKSLYEMIWKPLEMHLEGINSVYFSPSGLLHRINLDAIPVTETETLADKYKLIQLNSTRQLVIPDQIRSINNEAILYGGIQYETDSTARVDELSLASRSRGQLSNNAVNATLRGGSWNYLAGTEREVNSIEKIIEGAGIKVRLEKASEATEESFKNIGSNNAPSAGILHVATHGFFFPDPKEKAGSSQLAVGSQEPVFKISDQPMLRSGLILAGGNAAWQGKQTVEGKEDGILTAYEISQMNLSNTQLVVLSACETGLGDIQGNEGVYGLQRAFKIAGAKYLIMSLWQVPDKQTSLLMTTFYRKWLGAEGPGKGGNKMTIPNAFHAAQKQLRENGLDPFNWAGFVLVE